LRASAGDNCFMQLLTESFVAPFRALASMLRGFGELVWPLPVAQPIAVRVSASPYAGDPRRRRCRASPSRC
jgi:hypothetical protein